MSLDGATMEMIRLLLRNVVVKQMRARGFEGIVSTAHVVDDQLWVKVGAETVPVFMTNTIQALASSIWRMRDDSTGEHAPSKAHGE